MPNDQVLTLSTAVELSTDVQKKLLSADLIRSTVTALPPIADRETAVWEAGELTDVRSRIAFLEGEQDHVLEPAHDIQEGVKKVIARVSALFAPGLQALRHVEQIYKARQVAWNEREQARIADESRALREEQRRRDQEAAEMAASERARAIEQARIAEQAAAAAEQRRQEAIAAGDNRKAVAAAAEVASKLETAAAVMSNAEAKVAGIQMAAAAAYQVPPTVGKIEGVVLVDKWVAELAPGYDSMEAARDAIVIAAATDARLRGLLLIDESALRKLAESLKTAMSVPGFVARNRPYARGSNKR